MPTISINRGSLDSRYTTQRRRRFIYVHLFFRVVGWLVLYALLFLDGPRFICFVSQSTYQAGVIYRLSRDVFMCGCIYVGGHGSDTLNVFTSVQSGGVYNCIKKRFNSDYPYHDQAHFMTC